MHLQFSKATIACVWLGAATLAGCGGGGSVALAPATATATSTAIAATASPTATAIAATPTPTPTPTPTAAPTAQPQVVHVGFQHLATADPTYGSVAFYAPNTGNAAVISVLHGSQVVFSNDGTGAPHTASGLGTSGFPSSFDNTNGATAGGSTIDGSLTWSTGSLSQGATSAAFTVGAPGAYYFGCAFHYDSDAMRDVLVSM